MGARRQAVLSLSAAVHAAMGSAAAAHSNVNTLRYDAKLADGMKYNTGKVGTAQK